MALKDLLKDPLDENTPDGLKFMQRVQGNLIKGHGRHHSALLFLRFGPDVKAVRAWIAHEMCPRLAHARRQAAQTEGWRVARGVGEPFFAFFLSHQGYQTLGIDAASIPNDPYFVAGMKTVPTGVPDVVLDPPVSQWDENFQGTIDAMVLVADADRSRLDITVEALTKRLVLISQQLFIERGDQQTFDFNDGRGSVDIEHFGHQDGISQPWMSKQEADKEVKARGGANWNPVAPLKLGFIEEPGATDQFGSYLVFRKLGQNVKSFRQARDGLAAALGIDVENAAALAVGRFRDGRPVVPTTVAQPKADPNDFNFGVDPKAGLCPFQAHIRKTNPRGDLVRRGAPQDAELMNRIVRRGITYGDRFDLLPGSLLPAPDTGVGLLFMCYQARIGQFAIQQVGSDSNDFVDPGVGPDAVLGRNDKPAAQKWPSNGAPSDKTFLMANFISMLGGEYFFAPSPAFLESL
jgi:deferrochelatase/peroxidase EfeB